MAYRKITHGLMLGALAASTAVSAHGGNTRGETALTKSLARSGITVPAGGLTEACSGFRNLGQCIAALRTASRLNLPGGFAALKDLMTGPNRLSLGDAIRQLNPNAEAEPQQP